MSKSTITYTTRQSIPADEAFDRFQQLMKMTTWKDITWFQADVYRDEDFRLLGRDERGEQHALRFPALHCGDNETATQAIIDILHHDEVQLGLGQDLGAALRLKSSEHIMINS